MTCVDDVNRDEERQRTEPALPRVDITVRFLGADGVEGGGDDVVVRRTTSAAAARTAKANRFVGGTPLPGEPFYLVPGLVPGDYTVSLDPATLPSETSPFTDRDGGDPGLTTVSLDTDSVDDADFGVFRNVAPGAPRRPAAPVAAKPR